jgi:hypothetical protein
MYEGVASITIARPPTLPKAACKASHLDLLIHEQLLDDIPVALAQTSVVHPDAEGQRVLQSLTDNKPRAP